MKAVIHFCIPGLYMVNKGKKVGQGPISLSKTILQQTNLTILKPKAGSDAEKKYCQNVSKRKAKKSDMNMLLARYGSKWKTIGCMLVPTRESLIRLKNK